MKPRIAFLDRATIPEHVAFKQLSIDHEWLDFDLTSAQQLLEHAKDAEVLITNKVPINAQAIKALPQLKHIAVIATGYNIIDINACKINNISVSNTPEYSVTSVSEHVLGMIFALRRHLFTYRDSILNGEWQKSPYFHAYKGQTFDLKGATLGIIGGGSLGKATARLAEAIGMNVVFANRKEESSSSRYVRQGYLDFDEVIRNSDVISIHCPLNEATQNLIALKELKAMKPSALLINTARGGIVNEADLAQALSQKLIAGAALDVATIEPIRDDNPLLSIVDLPNFLLTPHVAWSSDSALQCQADMVIDNIAAYLENEPLNRVI